MCMIMPLRYEKNLSGNLLLRAYVLIVRLVQLLFPVADR